MDYGLRLAADSAEPRRQGGGGAATASLLRFCYYLRHRADTFQVSFKTTYLMTHSMTLPEPEMR